jgi:hypothetical protein
VWLEKRKEKKRKEKKRKEKKRKEKKRKEKKRKEKKRKELNDSDDYIFILATYLSSNMCGIVLCTIIPMPCPRPCPYPYPCPSLALVAEMPVILASDGALHPSGSSCNACNAELVRQRCDDDDNNNNPSRQPSAVIPI